MSAPPAQQPPFLQQDGGDASQRPKKQARTATNRTTPRAAPAEDAAERSAELIASVLALPPTALQGLDQLFRTATTSPDAPTRAAAAAAAASADAALVSATSRDPEGAANKWILSGEWLLRDLNTLEGGIDNGLAPAEPRHGTLGFKGFGTGGGNITIGTCKSSFEQVSAEPWVPTVTFRGKQEEVFHFDLGLQFPGVETAKGNLTLKDTDKTDSNGKAILIGRFEFKVSYSAAMTQKGLPPSEDFGLDLVAFRPGLAPGLA